MGNRVPWLPSLREGASAKDMQEDSVLGPF